MVWDPMHSLWNVCLGDMLLPSTVQSSVTTEQGVSFSTASCRMHARKVVETNDAAVTVATAASVCVCGGGGACVRSVHACMREHHMALRSQQDCGRKEGVEGAYGWLAAPWWLTSMRTTTTSTVDLHSTAAAACHQSYQ